MVFWGRELLALSTMVCSQYDRFDAWYAFAFATHQEDIRQSVRTFRVTRGKMCRMACCMLSVNTILRVVSL
jgi:hypothetical protein